MAGTQYEGAANAYLAQQKQQGGPQMPQAQMPPRSMVGPGGPPMAGPAVGGGGGGGMGAGPQPLQGQHGLLGMGGPQQSGPMVSRMPGGYGLSPYAMQGLPQAAPPGNFSKPEPKPVQNNNGFTPGYIGLMTGMHNLANRG